MSHIITHNTLPSEPSVVLDNVNLAEQKSPIEKSPTLKQHCSRRVITEPTTRCRCS